ncbi:ABC bile acid transporter [Cordyceps fumosorosea ARSEF 2679]|uniref:ABC bile acid transporter n=1 Tax=Cordyceps fumosorosea (strain ARSEF 2679) TaxID=1081104 RepID=A0A162J5E9_CORFA|nr:ABC bile acid transporter [Cordyceps fumosorosea ARSEF 2679]OAA63982.1 ABC bile acid transporter [Cordyceps fumosorosea ARSEF 2679]
MDDKSSKDEDDESSIFKEMRRNGAKASMVFTHSHRVPNIVTKLLTTLIFLNKLVGWRVLVPTLSLAFFFMGIDAIIALQHHKTEEALNKQTSENSTVIANALLKIRQIKLSAAEDEWMIKAREIRSKELRLRRKHSLLICASKLVSGVVSAVLAGVPLYLCTLRASLASLPFEVSDWVEGWNGLQRLQGYFAAPEAERTTETASEDILLDKAAMAWNKDARKDGKLELKASLQFPRGQLSVVTGKTGSGQSLLLSSIAGEAALLSGEFRAPVPHAA